MEAAKKRGGYKATPKHTHQEEKIKDLNTYQITNHIISELY